MIPTDVALVLISIVGSFLAIWACGGGPAIKETIKEFIKECRRGRNSK